MPEVKTEKARFEVEDGSLTKYLNDAGENEDLIRRVGQFVVEIAMRLGDDGVKVSRPSKTRVDIEYPEDLKAQVAFVVDDAVKHTGLKLSEVEL